MNDAPPASPFKAPVRGGNSGRAGLWLSGIALAAFVMLLVFRPG